MYSNISLTAIKEFKRFGQDIDYNDQIKAFYKAFYKHNVGCDFITDHFNNLEQYKLIVVPSLYAAADDLLEKLNKYVENGGHIICSLRSGFSDEYVKVRSCLQPGIISKVCGVTYNQFVDSKQIGLKNLNFEISEIDNILSGWMELLNPQENVEVLANYDHPYWKEYAAVTHNKYGKGSASYIACSLSEILMDNILKTLLKKINIKGEEEYLSFPLIIRKATNKNMENITFVFNYSMEIQEFIWEDKSGTELVNNHKINRGNETQIKPWGFLLVKED